MAVFVTGDRLAAVARRRCPGQQNPAVARFGEKALRHARRRRHRRRRLAGEGLFGRVIVGKCDLDLQLVARVVRHRRVRARGRIVYVPLHVRSVDPHPLVAVGDVGQTIHIRNARRRYAQRRPRARRPRNRRRARRRVVHRHYVDGYGIDRDAIHRAVVHLEDEGRIGAAVAVRHRRVFELAGVDVGLRHRLIQRHRRFIELEGADRRQRHHLDARERVAGVGVGEGEIARYEGMGLVLVRRHRRGRRCRRGVVDLRPGRCCEQRQREAGQQHRGREAPASAGAASHRVSLARAGFRRAARARAIAGAELERGASGIRGHSVNDCMRSALSRANNWPRRTRSPLRILPVVWIQRTRSESCRTPFWPIAPMPNLHDAMLGKCAPPAALPKEGLGDELPENLRTHALRPLRQGLRRQRRTPGTPASELTSRAGSVRRERRCLA